MQIPMEKNDAHGENECTNSLSKLKTEEIKEFLIKAKNKYHPIVDIAMHKIDNLILETENQNTPFYLVIDIVSHKPKYGEVLLVMQLAIILNKLGLNIKCFIFVQDAKSHILKQLIETDEVMLNLLNDIYPITKLLLGYTEVTYEFVSNISTQNTILKDLKNNILFADQLIQIRRSKGSQELFSRQYNLFDYNQELLQMVLIKNNNRLRKIKTPWLIGDILKAKFERISKIRLDSEKLYYATNFGIIYLENLRMVTPNSFYILQN